MRDDFEFRGVGSGVLQRLHAAMEFQSFLDSATDGAVTGPGDVARDKAKVTDDRDAFARHRLDEEGTGGSIDGAGACIAGSKPEADSLHGRGEAMRGNVLQKAQSSM